MTGGAWLMTDQSGKVQLADEALQSFRGEVKRFYTDTEHRYQGSLLGASGGTGIDYRLTAGGISWSEGDALDLEGHLVGPGIQIGTLDHVEPFFYTSEVYKISGRALGENVEGFVFLDHGYWPHGRDWKEWKVFGDFQLSWSVYANEFDDGTVEWGQVAIGRDGFNFVAIADADGPVAMDSGTQGGIDPTTDDWAQRIGYRAHGGRTWIFELGSGGQLSQFSEARGGAGYRAQVGRVGMHGDTRKVKLGFAWGESFMERFRDEGTGTVDDLIKPR
jgi:hypothetical protein